MWHASVAPQRRQLSEAELRVIAFDLLAGYGNARLGQWTEFTGRAFHLRRRLSNDEARRVGPVVDVRGTPEAMQRLLPVSKIAPEWLIAEELGHVSRKAFWVPPGP